MINQVYDMCKLWVAILNDTEEGTAKFRHLTDELRGMMLALTAFTDGDRTFAVIYDTAKKSVRFRIYRLRYGALVRSIKPKRPEGRRG